MKFNWGWAIAIFMTCFIGFIMFFVIKAQGVRTELYADDYYQQEVEYQTAIDAKRNGNQYKNDFNILQKENHLLVEFPEELRNAENGNVNFYRTNNSALDRNFAFSMASNDGLYLLKENFEKGQYEVKYTWKKNNKDYMLLDFVNIK